MSITKLLLLVSLFTPSLTTPNHYVNVIVIHSFYCDELTVAGLVVVVV